MTAAEDALQRATEIHARFARRLKEFKDVHPTHFSLRDEKTTMTQNLPEGLAAEIKRVTEIKGQFEAMRGMPQVIVEPQIAIMEHELKEAVEAAGSMDIVRMMRAYTTLEGYKS